MSKQRLEAIHPDFDGRIIEVDFNDADGVCNGTNSANWKNLIEFTGTAGNWTGSWKAPVSAMMTSRYDILNII